MAKRQVAITHPEKVYFPSGFTKADMIRYYAAAAPVMVPHLRDRPMTLIRFPSGVRGEKFYEKNAPGHAPSWIKTAEVARRHHDGVIRYLLVNDLETLAWCANLGAIEFHPFLHKAAAQQRPTHLAFDLDPGDGADLLTCIEVAEILRGLFGKLGLRTFPKVSGSKGLQLYIPLNTPVTYEATAPFAKAVAELLAKQFPKLVVSEMPKLLRRGRVLIDWSQNSEAKTTVGVYSLRGKHDQPFVSAPVAWEEIEEAAKKKDIARLFFSPAEVLARIRRHGDLFGPVLTLKQKLPATSPGGLVAASKGRSSRGAVGTTAAATAAPVRNPKGRAPKFVEPMKPRLVSALPEGEGWTYEVKWDGYRAMLAKHGQSVQLWSRNERLLSDRFPGVVVAGATLKAGRCLVDGEVVAVDANGVPSFQALQGSASTGHTIVFYAFDLLEREGKELLSQPLRRRREELREVLQGSTVLLSGVLPGTAKEVVAAVGRLGLEGVVAKRAESAYQSGERSGDWQKVRLRRGQEFVIGGFKPGMEPFESVLVGFYEGRKLMFAGKVRPGFTPATRAQVWKLIGREQIKSCPFANLPDALKKGRWGEGVTAEEMKTLRWVRPKHVAEIEFVEWTSGGHLRHAAYRGLRPDKAAKEVTRE